MTARPVRPGLITGVGARLLFVDTLEPLPLLDPTGAAKMLQVKRHTLACYRNLGVGPPFYKFGRWIRYALNDLQQWLGVTPDDSASWQPKIEREALPGTLLLLNVTAAARFLTVTSFCLTNYRAEGVGPRYCRFGRTVHYPVDELRRWARKQRHGHIKFAESSGSLEARP